MCDEVLVFWRSHGIAMSAKDAISHTQQSETIEGNFRMRDGKGFNISDDVKTKALDELTQFRQRSSYGGGLANAIPHTLSCTGFRPKYASDAAFYRHCKKLMMKNRCAALGR